MCNANANAKKLNSEKMTLKVKNKIKSEKKC